MIQMLNKYVHFSFSLITSEDTTKIWISKLSRSGFLFVCFCFGLAKSQVCNIISCCI